ncbi:MAG TPA: helix-turn-helix domain-containing protein, partial [Agromyces mariniharenae]|nr:helix-turn-helix domain-containing protein [Agromyces mariniharenae]
MPERGKGIRAERKPNRGPSAGPANRRALIAAARDVFATEGLQAPFSAVAKKAGVGQGSLYRHFPDRLSLAVAVFDENLDELAVAV